MDLNLNYLNTFFAVARTGNLTNATRELNVSQPSVSLTIQKLEKALGTQLFERIPRGMRLTAEGVGLFNAVSDGFGVIEQSIASLASAEPHINRTLSIAGSQSIICTRVLGDLLDRYLDSIPSVQVRLRGCSTYEALNRVSHGRSDLAFVYSPVAPGDSYTAIPIAQTEAIFIVGPGRYKYLSECERPISDIVKAPMISYSEAGYGRFFWNEVFSSADLAAAARIDVSSIEMMLVAVKENKGVGVILRQSAERSLRLGRVFEVVPTDVIMPKRNLCVVVPKNSELPPHVESFLAMTLELGGINEKPAQFL